MSPGPRLESAEPDASRTTRTFASEFALVAVLFLLYTAGRRIVESDAATAEANAESLLRFEDRLGIDVEASLNARLAQRETLASAAAWVYRWLHWTTVVIALAVMWWRDRPGYRRLRNALALSAVVGLACYWLLPVAPPRLLDGFVDVVYGAQPDQEGRPPGGSNVYAAFPSFHVGWPAVAGVALASTTGTATERALVLVPAIVLAFIVVATANHYLVDVAGGVAVALTCYVVVSRWSTRAERGRRPGSE